MSIKINPDVLSKLSVAIKNQGVDSARFSLAGFE